MADLERTNLVALLAPQVGWKLDALIGTTYGLEVESLLGLLIGLIGSELGAGADRIDRLSPFAVLQALLPMAGCIQIVADRSNIRPPAEMDSRLLTLLDGVIRDVHLPTGSFHPKIWVARYVPRGQQDDVAAPRLRIVCGSRNLTAAATWELFAAFDAVEGRLKVQGDNLCTDTAHLLQRLPLDLAKEAPAARIIYGLWRGRTHIDGDSSARLRHQWPGPDPLSGYLPVAGTHLLVVSPFLKQAFLERAMRGFTRTTLISCPEALDALDPDFARGLTTWPNRVWAMKSGLVAGAAQADGDGRDDDEAHEVAELDLHAKLVIGEGGDAMTLLGSANATYAGWFRRNAEAVVELRPGLSRRGFLQSFAVQEGDPDARTDALVLRPWLAQWIPPPSGPSVAATAEATARALLVTAIRWFAALPVTGTWGVDGLRVGLDVGANLSDLADSLAPIQAAVIMRWSLASMPDEAHPAAALINGFSWATIRLAEVTELLRVEVQTCEPLPDGQRPKLTRLFRFRLDGPLDRKLRNQSIYKELLTAADFERLLDSLLTGVPAAPGEANGTLRGKTGDAGNKGGVGRLSEVTLEQLLRACTADPLLVGEIDSLLDAFADDSGLVSSDFLRVWPVVRAAFQSAKRRRK